MVFEGAGKAGVWAGPGDRLGMDTVDGTLDPCEPVSQITAHAAEVERPPPAGERHDIIDMALFTADGTPVTFSLIRTDVDVDGVFLCSGRFYAGLDQTECRA